MSEPSTRRRAAPCEARGCQTAARVHQFHTALGQTVRGLGGANFGSRKGVTLPDREIAHVTSLHPPSRPALPEHPDFRERSSNCLRVQE
jgi:hypothetical protein